MSFRWQRGKRKYNYNFYRLESHDQDLLSNPSLDIPIRGRIPRKPGGEDIHARRKTRGQYLHSEPHVYFHVKDFSVRLPCTGNLSGIAAFSIGLEILSRRRKLAGTPLQLRLRREANIFSDCFNPTKYLKHSIAFSRSLITRLYVKFQAVESLK